MKQKLSVSKMKLFIILFLLTIFLCGCSSTYTVRSTAAEDAISYEQMNENLKGQNATIELRDGKGIYAHEIQITNDSVSWLEEWTYEKSKTNIGQLNKIVIYENVLNWDWVGLVIGSLGGGVGGLLFGINSDNIFALLVGPIIGMLAGAIFGTIIGRSIGHSYKYEIYEFPIEQPKDSLRNGNSPQK